MNARCWLLAVLLLATDEPVAAAETFHRGELAASVGFVRLAGSQDLGDYERLDNLRNGALDTALAALDLRGAICLAERFCGGVVLGTRSGVIAERTALLFEYRGELIVHLLTGRVMPFIVATAGAMTLVSADAALGRDTDPAFGYGAGVKLRLGPRWRLRLDFAHLMTDDQLPGSLAHNFALTAGFGVAIGPERPRPPALPALDSDGDMLIDRRDRCPTRAEDPDGVEDDDGCPEGDR